MSPAFRKLFLFVALTFSACDCDDDDRPDDYVVTREKPGVDFSAYHTFKVLDSSDPDDYPDAGIDPDDIPDDVRLNLDTANDQARIELTDLGLTEVGEDEEADLVVFSLAKVDEEGGYYWECVPGYWWGYWGWVWDPCAWLAPIYVEYSIGNVVVGLVDPAEEEVVFGGLLQGLADGSGEAEERVRNGVHVMFQSYPAEPD